MANDYEIGKIKEATQEVVAFFDLFDYPLTSYEIWQYLNVKCELSEVMEVLEPLLNSPLGPSYASSYAEAMADKKASEDKKGGELSEVIKSKNGFYFLKGREKIIKTRLKRYNYTDQKMKRALRVTRLFKVIPWIKMAAVGNIIGAHNLKNVSDIDLFIISEKNRIWITRFFCVLITKLLGLRPKAGREQNKICLSFFISEEGMDLRGLMLKEHFNKQRDCDIASSANAEGALRNDTIKKDIYFIYWLAGLVIIYDSNKVYEKFIRVNSWIKESLPNWQPAGLHYRRNAGKGRSRFYRDTVDMLIGGLESNLKKYQLRKMPLELKGIMNKDTRVVVNDKVLKLHVKDRRGEYLNKFYKLLDSRFRGNDSDEV